MDRDQLVEGDDIMERKSILKRGNYLLMSWFSLRMGCEALTSFEQMHCFEPACFEVAQETSMVFSTCTTWQGVIHQLKVAGACFGASFGGR